MAEPITNDQLDRATDPEYAAVYPLAVVALIVAALGGAAFLAPPLVVVPVAATVMGLAAVRKIRKSQGVLAGRKLALAAVVVGIVIAAAGGTVHLIVWLNEQRTLDDLKTQAAETIDDVLAGRYETVFARLPDDSPQRKAGPEAFRNALSRLFEGGGNLVRRDLMSLQILPTERGVLVAPADMRVTLEARILQVTLWFRLDENGGWRLVGIGGQETLESIAKYGDDNTPPDVPAPYERGPRSRP
ncbi:MAG TPA: hypothetical protein VM238_07710 [Phycisphaerae bacterium]|nr:hypothetical protein [Phycisphaerae bacterium]